MQAGLRDQGKNCVNIQDRSFLKVYNKDPAHAFNHTRGTINGDVRMQRDISYSIREGATVHRPGSATYPHGPVSPPPAPVPHSMPSSPSRIPYGGARPTAMQGNPTMQRERIPSLPASRSISPSPSAILERRDVKPDEDMGNKNIQLLRNDNMYPEPYLYHEGRMSMASSHGGHPLDLPDHVIAYHRSAMRSASTYSNSSMQMEMMEQSLYRQKSRKHAESHLPTLGSKTPPVSPHRVADIRMMEMHAHNAHLPPHAMPTDRSSPLRQSFKKEQGPGMFVEAKVRNTGGVMGVADIVPSPTEKQVFGGYGVPVSPKDPYTSDLENFVETLKKDLNTSQRSVTLKEVEDRAFMLRQIGEAVSGLKGEFPYLQNRMRAVLRVEVEAVRFLKEEPHKLDSLLKRIRNMTDNLSALRRHASDSPSKSHDVNQNSQFIIPGKVTETNVQEEKSQMYLQPTQCEIESTTESPTTSVKSEVVPLSAGLKVQQVQSSPVLMQQSQHSSALVNHTADPSTQTSHNTESLGSHQTSSCTMPETLKSNQQTPVTQTASHEGSSMQSLFIEEMNQVAYRNRTVSIEEAERKFEEKRQNLDHYNGKEFEKMLEEAQANIMKSIPSLEVPPQPQKTDVIEKLDVADSKPESVPESEKVVKSPPPPPPRRMYPPGSGINSVWTTESTYILRKENSKDPEDTAPKEASAQETDGLNSTVSAVKSSYGKDDDEEEGARIMAELQVSCTVSKECSNAERPEDKWKKQTVQNKISDSAENRQEGSVVVNEKSTYSLFIGRKEDSDTFTTVVDKCNEPVLLEKDFEKSKKEDVIVSPVEERMKNTVISCLNETHGDIAENKIKEFMDKPENVLNVERKDGNIPVGEVLESPDPLTVPKPVHEQELTYLDVGGQTVVLRSKTARRSLSQDVDSPTRSPTELNSPADNIAFMITKTKVQALSTGEVHDIVSKKGEDIQTVNINGDGNKEKVGSANLEHVGSEDPVVCTDKKPVIIIFDEPMDIKSAYKRLSTIFEECDDELEKMMSEAKIEEEEEEEADGTHPQKEDGNGLTVQQNNKVFPARAGLGHKYRFNYPSLSQMRKTALEDADSSQTNLTNEDKSNTSDYSFDQRQDVKKKFKFKFPKKQLAALTQAIRTGTKTGKKTLQVVVYEEEEEPDGTVKQHKETKRFEITGSTGSKERDENVKYNVENDTDEERVSIEKEGQGSRTDEIRQNTYKTLDSLEQTIKQLENTMSEITPKTVADVTESREGSRVYQDVKSGTKDPISLDEAKPGLESSTSIPTTARKGSNGGLQTSRMPIPMSSKSRQGNVEKATKQPKLQEPQRQYRQANGGTKKAGGDVKASTPTLSVSKIPALSSNPGKSSSIPAQSSDTTNTPNQSMKSPVSTNNANTQASRTVNSSALVRPTLNGSSKLQPPPTYTGKGHHLSFSPQASNGRPSLPSPTASSSSSPTSVSPTSLTQGVKSIRTIHTPNFTSYKSQNGAASKGQTAKETS
ncbi:hypothetical protein GDO86_011899 [Hymenochirus boettgeri]|uniref:Ig-like domain-containing protein n=1 Tax=Hymenochirus boettgeri TaxID=247094 RepID=A0A8T2JHZ5_9PIPI|nr:hypothetical protein GDO86_011899 [Hymenochirus boettgeri]